MAWFGVNHATTACGDLGRPQVDMLRRDAVARDEREELANDGMRLAAPAGVLGQAINRNPDRVTKISAGRMRVEQHAVAQPNAARAGGACCGPMHELRMSRARSVCQAGRADICSEVPAEPPVASQTPRTRPEFFGFWRPFGTAGGIGWGGGSIGGGG